MSHYVGKKKKKKKKKIRKEYFNSNTSLLIYIFLLQLSIPFGHLHVISDTISKTVVIDTGFIRIDRVVNHKSYTKTW